VVRRWRSRSMSLYGGSCSRRWSRSNGRLGWCILVNNAGIGAFGGVLGQAPEDWDRVIETHLNACFLLSKVVATSMVKQRRGKIINIASLYAVFGAAFAPSYIAAKGAVVQLTKLKAIELAPSTSRWTPSRPDLLKLI
jgi:NAD(P)-dependent dehydrogenase (short-subunit alcohol dehydrogenase family)